MSKGIDKIFTYGTQQASVKGKTIPSETFLKLELIDEEKSVTINTQLVGDYNFPNVYALQQ
jgi:UDP-N-acetylmuramoyl-tripeptide--D-alanyl-D-alanine ligase